ncbi:conserved hypothetical protein [Candidatus Desulfarcum epimagneticum]|uniref:ParB/Sulfiredoxin domain-containing protein n=1 Tax=uncultured Desulfobacteraceae bacterium TaxID=218296 RepID=A0A484HJ10_9BACT|nr:conserved hypothetical protein [uncultured Desulfobacteraceae bacterium]
MDWPIESYSIVNLMLDQNNIRTPISQKDQNALIRDMFTNENAFDIVKSYVENGIFPDEFPIVIKENGNLITIEGNRRLAALKALNMPKIVRTWENKIKKLRNPEITQIKVVVAPDRTAAIKHIANKHTIDYRRPWKPLRQAYFYKSQIDNGKTIEEIINEFPDHNVPRFWKMIEMHHLAKSIKLNESLEAKVHDDRNFPITNLERFYNDKTVSHFLGIEFDEYGNVRGRVAKDEFEKGYKKIIEDIGTGEINSRSYNTAKERASYVQNALKKHKPSLRKKGSFRSRNFKEIKPKMKRPKKNSNTKKFPKGLFHKSETPFRVSSTPLKLMYNELHQLDVDRFPNATHDLLRSFLECALAFYLKDTGEYKKIRTNGKHNPKLSEMLTFISNEKFTLIGDRNLKQSIKQIKSNWKEPYSLARMNMINHNENWTSTEKDVRSTWGKLEGLFRIILNPEKR